MLVAPAATGPCRQPHGRLPAPDEQRSGSGSARRAREAAPKDIGSATEAAARNPRAVAPHLRAGARGTTRLPHVGDDPIRHLRHLHAAARTRSVQQSRADDRGVVPRHVGNHEGQRAPRAGDCRQSAALQSRERTPPRVHRFDAIPRGEGVEIQALQCGEPDSRNQRLHEARCAARDEKQQLRLLRHPGDERLDRLARGEAARIGHRVGRLEHAKPAATPDRRRAVSRQRHDDSRRRPVGEDVQHALEHRTGGLPDRDHVPFAGQSFGRQLPPHAKPCIHGCEPRLQALEQQAPRIESAPPLRARQRP